MAGSSWEGCAWRVTALPYGGWQLIALPAPGSNVGEVVGLVNAEGVHIAGPLPVRPALALLLQAADNATLLELVSAAVLGMALPEGADHDVLCRLRTALQKRDIRKGCV